MSRRPKAPELERRQGYPGHRPPKAAVLIGGRVTDPREMRAPSGMTKEERAAFRDIVRAMTAGGLLDRADRFSVEAAARLMARTRQVSALIGALPVDGRLLTETVRGTTSVHPYLGHERELLNSLRLALEPLGLGGPSSRYKAGAGAGAEKSGVGSLIGPSHRQQLRVVGGE